MIAGILLIIGLIGALLSWSWLEDNWKIFPEPKNLVTTGIYKKIRHPIYIFSMLTWAGISLLFWPDQIIPFLICLGLIQFSRAKYEEKMLEQKFGSKYLEYKKGTWF